MNDLDLEPQTFTMGDVLSIMVLMIVSAIPVLGWFFGLKFGAVLLAESIKRRRAMVWLGTLAAAVPATIALAWLAMLLGMIKEPLFFVLFGYAPVGILMVSVTGAWVEVKRGQARRARQEVEAA